MLRISKNTYRIVRNINQSDDRFHLLLCTRKQWHPQFERGRTGLKNVSYRCSSALCELFW